jgi:hypothetical protein
MRGSTLIFSCILLTPAIALAGGHLTRKQGQEIAEKIARENGIDLSIYLLGPFDKLHPFDVSVEKQTEWDFYYYCKGARPPGCYFTVIVDRATGYAQFLPGL